MFRLLIIIIILLFTDQSNGQITIKGQLIDEYGDNGWAEVYLNGKRTKWLSHDGKVNLTSYQKGINELTFKYYGHFVTKIKIEGSTDTIDLGNIFLINHHFWLDGPKTGVISGNYSNGQTKYIVNIKNWALHGESTYYNSNGEISQMLSFKKGKLLKIHIRENGHLKEMDFELTKKGEVLIVKVNS